MCIGWKDTVIDQLVLKACQPIWDHFMLRSEPCQSSRTETTPSDGV